MTVTSIMDDDLLLQLMQLRAQPEQSKTKSHYCCEKCSVDLLVDQKEYYNVCPNCGRCYPYCDHRPGFDGSPPYKRKWHLMTVINRHNFVFRYGELEAILSLFLKLDYDYSTLFPGKNMMNVNFIIKAIAHFIGYDHISMQISLKNVKPKTLRKWFHRFNLVVLANHEVGDDLHS